MKSRVSKNGTGGETLMMQQGAIGPTQDHVDSTYGGYEGEQAYAYHSFASPDQGQQREEGVGKLNPSKQDNKNKHILTAFAMALGTLLILAVLCVVFVGGTGGWISFCAASLAIFIMTAVVIDKIK